MEKWKLNGKEPGPISEKNEVRVILTYNLPRIFSCQKIKVEKTYYFERNWLTSSLKLSLKEA